MAKVLFIDDRMEEIERQWSESGCGDGHQLLTLESFVSIERTQQIVNELHPDAIVVGFGLSHPDVNGADVIMALREQGYIGKVIANSGGPITQFIEAGVTVDASTNRKPRALCLALAQHLIEL